MTNEQEQHIIDAIDEAKNAFCNNCSDAYDYRDLLQGINNELCEIGRGNMGYGCLAEIRSELQKINKGQIVAAMITATKQTYLESLKKFSDLADEYLDYEAKKS